MARTIATNTSEKKKLDAAELAVEYGITKHTVYRLARAGQIPCVRIGRSLRFDRDAVAAHLTPGRCRMNPDLENLLAWLELHGNDPDVVAGAARVGRLLAQGGEQ